MSRAEKSKKNIIHGLIFQGLYLVFMFVTRIVMLKYAGIEAVSINGLLTEVITVLSIAELGVWMAISYHLYGPLAEDDHARVAAIMHLFRQIYNVIGVFLLVLGLCFLPFAPRLLKDIDVETSYFLVAYTLVLLKAAIPYFFSYKVALLNADQKNHVYLKLNTIMRSASFALEIAALIITHSLLVYLVIDMLYNIAVNYLASRKVNKLYPYLKMNVSLKRDEKKQVLTSVRRMFVGRLSNKILNSTDNILISTIVSTVMVGFYTQYSMFTNGILRVFSQVNDSITGSIGHLTATESNQKCKEMYENINFFFFATGLVVSMCFFGGIGPFLIGVIGKEYLLDETILLLITTNLFLEILKMPLWTFVNANGMFQYDQVISLAGCILNVISSIVLGINLGISGILIGTLASLILMIVCKLVLIYKKAFRATCGFGLTSYAVYTALFTGSIFAMHRFVAMTSSMSHILQFLVNCCIAVAFCMIILVVFFVKTKRFTYWFQFAKRKFNRRRLLA